MKKILDSKLDDSVFVVDESGRIDEYKVISINQMEIKIQKSQYNERQAEFKNDHDVSNLIEFGTVLKLKRQGYEELLICDKSKAYKIAAEKQCAVIEKELSDLQAEVEQRVKLVKARFIRYIETKSKGHE